MDDYTKQKLDVLIYSIVTKLDLNHKIDDENIRGFFKELDILPFPENHEYVKEKIGELRNGSKRPKINWVDAQIENKFENPGAEWVKLAEETRSNLHKKKLTLRLDSENVDLLTKLEKRFPSLSQNQVLNHVIEYGSKRILEVTGKEPMEEMAARFESNRPFRLNGNAPEFGATQAFMCVSDYENKTQEVCATGILGYKIHTQKIKNSHDAKHTLELMVEVGQEHLYEKNTFDLRLYFEEAKVEYVCRFCRFISKTLEAKESDSSILTWKMHFDAEYHFTNRVDKNLK